MASNPSITIAIDPEYVHGITPVMLAESISKALAFGTDDPISDYVGLDALSAPLLVGQHTIGMIHIGVTA